MRKIVRLSFAFVMILLMLEGCVFTNKAKNPLLENEAFDIIGNQGILDSITLDDLQGDYTCTLWFVEYKNSQYSEDEFDCISWIDKNELNVSWEMNGNSYAFGQGIQFELEDGIIVSDNADDPDLIGAVKSYPSGHMVDGLGILEINESDLVRIHFQIVK